MRKLSLPIKERLALKLLTALLIVVIVVLSAYTSFAVLRERGKVRSELSSEGETLAELLAYGARVGVFAENRDQLKDAAAGIVGQRHVVRAAIYSADFRLLYAGQKDRSATYALRDIKAAVREASAGQGGVPAAETRDIVEFIRPVVIAVIPNAEESLYFGDRGVRKGERTIGYVSIALEKKTQRREILGIVKRNAIITLVFILVSTVIVYWQVKKMTRPLEKLTAGVNAIGAGREAAFVPVETADEIGKLASAFNTMLDRRRQAEEALRESEKKYRTLFEESKDAIFFDTVDGRILDLNPAGLELFGIASRDELAAIDVARDVYVNPGDREVFKTVLERTGYVKDYEAALRKKNGEIITVLITATVVRDGLGRVTAYRGIIRDVTSERKLEDQLRHSQKMEAVGQLTGGIAHDFNNILSAIISYGYLLQMDLEKGCPQQTFVTHLLASAERATNLTKSLLAFSRKQILDRNPVDLNQIVQTVETLLSKVIGEDITLRIKPSREELMVVADSGQMEQVLMNFATNARDAMPRGGALTIETQRVDLGRDFYEAHGYGEPGTYACLSVTDTGVGMDEATTKRIFEPFFTTKEVGKGTGLGLSIVYGIVRQHHGFVNVYSEPRMGTSFKVYLPVKDVVVEEAKTAAAATVAPGGTETILIAEDDEDLRKLARIVLRKFGYTLIEARDGDEAVEKFRQHQDAVDLVVLDIVMPKKNGREVYEEIQKIRPGVKTLFMSGYTANIMHQRGIIEQGLHFVSKPILPNVFLEKVREVLES
jgi:PAS domain S-box-containing protein